MFLELVTAVLGATTFTLVVNTWLTQIRLKRINAHLEKGEPARFLEEIDKELQRTTHEPVRTLLQINRSAGLVYLGAFTDGLAVLHAVDRTQFKKWHGQARRLLTSLYFNNLLYTLLLARRYEEARQVVAEAEGFLVPQAGGHQLDLCLQGTMAVYQYFCGNPTASRRTFEYLCTLDWPDQFKACNFYFLGRLELADGSFEQGMAHIERASRLAPKSYLGEEPRRLAEGRERVGAPGEGTRA